MPNKRHVPKNGRDRLAVSLPRLCPYCGGCRGSSAAFEPEQKDHNHDMCASEAQLHMPQRFSRSSDVLFGRKPMPLQTNALLNHKVK